MKYADGQIETLHETDLCEMEYVSVMCVWEGASPPTLKLDPT